MLKKFKFQINAIQQCKIIFVKPIPIIYHGKEKIVLVYL